MKLSGKDQLEEIVTIFEEKSGLKGLKTEIQSGTGVYKIFVANPTDRLFRLLEEACNKVVPSGMDDDIPVVTLKKDTQGNLLSRAEGKAFVQSLSESLNVNRYSVEKDFMARYTPSVANAESQIVASANHIVYGRRGAGKSMLLLYALHERINEKTPSIWIDLQVYSQRNDDEAIADILVEIMHQSSEITKDVSNYEPLIAKLQKPEIDETQIRNLLPQMRRVLGYFGKSGQDLFIFLDDFHVLAKGIQPKVLDILYAISRGNQLFLKVSAIETLTRSFDPSQKIGLEVPHDAQVIKLDYNLTVPDKAITHIEAILNAQAMYVGLPSIRRICTSNDVLPRLTWVAAGVPRDALYLFSQAMIKATQAGNQRVSVSNVNQAASETLTIKLKDLDADVKTQEFENLTSIIEKIRTFCVTDSRKNAFLVEILNVDKTYEGIRTLVDLRLLHIINEGVTIGEAGRKYLALVLDYGFYTGIRAARSVDLFNKQSKKVNYRDLRSLPVFLYN